MGEHSQNIVCHITQREQVALAKILVRAEAKTREERENKSAAFASVDDGGFGLDWTKDRIAEPLERSITSGPVIKAFHEARAAGQTEDSAVIAAMNQVARGVDIFFGCHGTTPIRISVPRKTLSWTLDTLNKMQAGGIDDFLIADIEDRFGRARAGGKDYALPDELQAPATKLDIVAVMDAAPIAAESLGG